MVYVFYTGFFNDVYMKKKFLDFYLSSVQDDSIFKCGYKGDYGIHRDGCGLCCAFMRADLPYLDLFLFEPDEDQWDEHYPWYGGPLGKFTPLRQNIVLFLAAMNGEL